MKPKTDLTAKIKLTIQAILGAMRLPNGQVRVFKRSELDLFERDLRGLEADIEELERQLSCGEVHRVVQIVVNGVDGPEIALARAEFEVREKRLATALEDIRKRERYLQEAEALLLRKVQAQQEEESRLEQKREDLHTRRISAGLDTAPNVVIEKA